MLMLLLLLLRILTPEDDKVDDEGDKSLDDWNNDDVDEDKDVEEDGSLQENNCSQY